MSIEESTKQWAKGLVGTTLNGRYALSKLLGAGGMGAVFAGRHTSVERAVAVKVLLPDCANNSDIVTRFHQEAKAAAAVARRGVVEVLDYDVDPVAGPFLVMEMLRGESLAGRLERTRVLTAPDLHRIMGSVLDTLQAVHGAGIVHRDLKPENIFLAVDDRGQEEVKIVDFGISRVSQDGMDSKLTQPGLIMGTPAYMSPEQASGSPVDKRADLYSAGAILFECLAGHPPFEGSTLNEIFAKVLTEPPTLLRDARPDLPASLHAVVEQALAKSPDHRFQTAAEMAVALQNAGMWSTGAGTGGFASPPGAPNTGRGVGTGPGFGQTPQPRFGQTPQPGFGQTPQPGFGQTPQPGFGQTPQGGFAGQSGPNNGRPTPHPGFGANPQLGHRAPIAAAPPKKGPPWGLIVIGGGLLGLLALGAMGIGMYFLSTSSTTDTSVGPGVGLGGPGPSLGFGGEPSQPENEFQEQSAQLLVEGERALTNGQADMARTRYQRIIELASIRDIQNGSGDACMVGRAELGLARIQSTKISMGDSGSTIDSAVAAFQAAMTQYTGAMETAGNAMQHGCMPIMACGSFEMGRTSERLALALQRADLSNLPSGHQSSLRESWNDTAQTMLESARSQYGVVRQIPGGDPACVSGANEALIRLR